LRPFCVQKLVTAAFFPFLFPTRSPPPSQRGWVGPSENNPWVVPTKCSPPPSPPNSTRAPFFSDPFSRGSFAPTFFLLRSWGTSSSRLNSYFSFLHELDPGLFSPKKTMPSLWSSDGSPILLNCVLTSLQASAFFCAGNSCFFLWRFMAFPFSFASVDSPSDPSFFPFSDASFSLSREGDRFFSFYEHFPWDGSSK